MPLFSKIFQYLLMAAIGAIVVTLINADAPKLPLLEYVLWCLGYFIVIQLFSVKRWWGYVFQILIALGFAVSAILLWDSYTPQGIWNLAIDHLGNAWVIASFSVGIAFLQTVTSPKVAS